MMTDDDQKIHEISMIGGLEGADTAHHKEGVIYLHDEVCRQLDMFCLKVPGPAETEVATFQLTWNPKKLLKVNVSHVLTR